jgi:tRNA(Ile)-lysidine synthase
MCSRETLFPQGTRALIMVSGGQDSLTLLELVATGLLLKDGPSEVLALHINHQLRGQDSLDDQALVQRHCERLGVELVVVPGGVDKSAGNVQEAARRVRREAALALARERGCSRIVLGHTIDDQVETMLYRMGRYGGVAAMRGMLPCDPPWVRPLLGLRRSDTETFCREHGLEFAVDMGNAYPGYARTGLREQVLPTWERVLPGATGAAARTAEVAAEIERVVASLLNDMGMEAGAPELDVAGLQGLPVPLRRLVLHAWLEGREGLEVSRKVVFALEGLLAGSGSSAVDLGAGWLGLREYDIMRLERGADGDSPVPEAVDLPVPGGAEWDGRVIRAEWAPRFRAPDPACETYVDADSITGSLQVRGVRPGDRMRPLGLAGSRKLQDILVDLRVPARRRPRVPLVVCGETILWACGVVSAEQGRITAETTRLVRFSVG